MADKKGGQHQGDGSSASYGIIAGGSVKAANAIVKAEADPGQTAGGVLAGSAVQVGQANLEAAVKDKETDMKRGHSRDQPSSKASDNSKNRDSNGKKPRRTEEQQSAASSSSSSRSTRWDLPTNVPSGAIAIAAPSFESTGKATARATVDPGTEGRAVAILAQKAKFKDVDAEASVVLTPEQKSELRKGIRAKLFTPASKEEDCYDLSGKKLFALMINNVFDDDESMDKYGEVYERIKRNGAGRDSDRLRPLLKEMGFDVTVRRNVKSNKLEDILNNFKAKIKGNGGMVLVIVSSHGGVGRPDTVCMDDFEEQLNEDGSVTYTVPHMRCVYQDIMYKFGGTEDKTLQNMPKLFLFNMCRNSWNPLPEDVSGDGVLETDATFKNTLKNTFAVFSTLPYEVSLRHTKEGSVFFIEFEQVFKEHWKTKTLKDMLDEVAWKVFEKTGQVPNITKFLFDKDVKFTQN